MPGVGAMGCVSPGWLGDGGGQPGGLGDRLKHWGQAISGGEPGEGLSKYGSKKRTKSLMYASY